VNEGTLVCACQRRIAAYDPGRAWHLKVPGGACHRGAGRLPVGLTGAGAVEERSTDRARRYRAHADEIRTTAEEVTHAESRAALLRLADTYERLATRLEAEPDQV